MNLLKELKEILEKNNKTIEDIKWVGNEEYYVDTNKFLELADAEYDNRVWWARNTRGLTRSW